MPEKQPEFVVTDRRKYRMEGDDVTANPEHSPAEAVAVETPAAPIAEPASEKPEPGGQRLYQKGIDELRQSATEYPEAVTGEDDLPPAPPPPTAEETEAGERAYRQTTERLDDLARANDLTGRREPPMNFERLVQSFYTSALVQLGMIGVPGQQQVRVDLIGARQTIDLLGVIKEKTASNLSADETKLLDSALFELRMAFLETMQLYAQQLQKQQAAAGGAGAGGATPFSAGAPPKR